MFNQLSTVEFPSNTSFIVLVDSQPNFRRMVQLADEFFGMRNDPSQISVDKKVIARLQRIHPATMMEKRTNQGPIAWILVIPTTNKVMKQFIMNKINEKELLKQTPLNVQYDSIYLCSALVLPEYRKRGLARKLLIKAVNSILKRHPIESLFYWEFSLAGKKLARSVASELRLPLFKRTGKR
jgi:GNAT superfamily N-acetyltransferase